MLKIYAAAVAQSPPEPLVIWWWNPDPYLISQWIGKGDPKYQLVKLLLPSESQECIDLRPVVGDDGKCSSDPSVSRGKSPPAGSLFHAGCQQADESMHKVLSASLPVSVFDSLTLTL